MRRVTTLTVVVLMVLVVGTLLLGGIQRVRLVANRQRCQNNLRMVWIAMTNYQDYNNLYPAATFPNAALPPEQRLSWLFELDPYVHSRMDPDWKPAKNEPWNSPKNVELARMRMPWYVCPSAASSTDSNGLALTYYVGMTGVGLDAATLPKEDPRAGFFGYERHVSLPDIGLEGLETTIAVIETGSENGPWIAGGWPTARPFDPGGRPAIGRDGQFGGLHTRGVNVLFAGGSSRFIRDSIDAATLRALCTITTRDPVGPLEE